MDVIDRRIMMGRVLAQMSSGGKIPDGYKAMRITNPTYFRLGDALFNWLSNVLPSTSLAVGFLEYDTIPENGTVYMFVWDGTENNSSYYRIVDGALGNFNPFRMTSTYLCIAEEGATFTIFYRDD